MLTLDGRLSPTMPSVASNYTTMNGDSHIHAALQREQFHHRHMWIITGPAGCGKSSVAQFLAKELSLPYLEGDDYHTVAAKQKMGHGIPLNDLDRWDWLISLREAAVARLSPTASSAVKAHTGVVVTCSALRRRYRDVIRVAAYEHHNVAVHFVYLRANKQVLMKRVLARQGHYMKSTMVQSQLEVLEEPDDSEQTLDVLEVDCSPSLSQVQKNVVVMVRETLADDA